MFVQTLIPKLAIEALDKRDGINLGNHLGITDGADRRISTSTFYDITIPLLF